MSCRCLRYESAAGICDGSGPGGPAAAMLHWEKAVHCFRLAGKADVAAKVRSELSQQSPA